MILFDSGLPFIRQQRVFGRVFGGVRNQHEQPLEQGLLLESLRIRYPSRNLPVPLGHGFQPPAALAAMPTLYRFQFSRARPPLPGGRGRLPFGPRFLGVGLTMEELSVQLLRFPIPPDSLRDLAG